VASARATGTWAADDARLREWLRPYRVVLASRARSQRAYRTSFALDMACSGLVGLVELAEVWVLFSNVSALGGLRFNQILLVFGLADLAFSMADLSFGHLDTLPDFLRAGTLDAFYLRPQPILAQLITSDISLRRLARAAIGAAALGIGLATAGVPWDPRTLGLLVLGLVSGYATFSALFVWAAGLQFFLVDGAEMTNAFVYGGRYAATQPASVWSRPLKLIFGFFFPMAFTAYLPAVAMLGLPGPQWLPAWLGWCTPVAAVWSWLMGLLCWRWGLRHYQGGGG
jgi:ABC-2 type transport system permease protein